MPPLAAPDTESLRQAWAAATVWLPVAVLVLAGVLLWLGLRQ